MKENFRGAHLKIRRASQHIEELRDVLEDFMKRQTYKAVAKFDVDPRYIVWTVRGDEVFRHDEFSPIIGDAIHNLRDSLDLALSVIMRNAGLNDRVLFPTADSPEKCREMLLRKTDRKRGETFPARLIIAIEERIQPYMGGRGWFLRVLHNLAIADKHRLIVPTIFGARQVDMQAEAVQVPIKFFVGVPIVDGSRLARIKASEWPEIKVDQEAEIDFSVEFDRRAGLMSGWSVVEGLVRLLNVTKQTIEVMGTCL